MTTDNRQFTITGIITRFRHRGLKRLYEHDDRSKLPPDLVERIREILALLDASIDPSGLDRPALRLHPLNGDRQGTWAVTVRANWRIIFRFENGHAVDVDFIDYH